MAPSAENAPGTALPLGPVTVTDASWPSFAVTTMRSLGATLSGPAGSAAKVKTQVARADPLVAPFAKGQDVAVLKVTVADQPLTNLPLVALEAVEQAGVLGRAWDAIRLWIR